MKKILFVIVSIIMITGLTTKSMAQVTENTDAKAKILTALTIAETQYLEFGSMGVLASTGGTCVVSVASARSATGGVTLSNLGATPSAAAYHVTGEPLYTYAITLPSTIAVTKVGGLGETMTIDNLLAKSTAGVESHTATGTLIAIDGDDDFTVGGTLNVSAGQVSGAYVDIPRKVDHLFRSKLVHQ
ncbi:MAG: DUF4402 domain-containing protein, partial [Bacteroidota bacterium]